MYSITYHYYRQGHLGMVILLMRYGANPEILDKEGAYIIYLLWSIFSIYSSIFSLFIH